MITIAIVFLLIFIYCWAAISSLHSSKSGTSIATTRSAMQDPVWRMTEKSAKKRLFVSLRALSQELDLTVYSLRNAVCSAASLIVEQLDFETIKLLEERLGYSLPPAAEFSVKSRSAAAGRLENCMAGCQAVCALIDVGSPGPGDRSTESVKFVSLLDRSKRQLSIFSFMMREERRIIKTAEGDLQNAQRWMEAATEVIRHLPLQERFAGMHASR